MKMIKRISIAGMGLLLAGCVERKLTIESDPPGAIVYLNQQEAGRTPVTRDFTWYGNYDVVLRKEGYETLKTNGAVNPPVWQWPVIDLFFDLLPMRLTDQHHLKYTLAQKDEPTSEGLIDRAREMRGMLESPEKKK